MSDFDKIVEQILRDAQAQGKFDNLDGQGRPLSLDNEREDTEEWAANHLLKNQNLRPAWLEEDLAIRQELEAARAALRRSLAWRTAELKRLAESKGDDALRHRQWVESEWGRAQQEFREVVKQLNQRIRNLNLKVPLERFQQTPVDAESEIRNVTL